MSEFLRNFTPLNTASLSKLANSDNEGNIADFIKTRGDKVKSNVLPTCREAHYAEKIDGYFDFKHP